MDTFVFFLRPLFVHNIYSSVKEYESEENKICFPTKESKVNSRTCITRGHTLFETRHTLSLQSSVPFRIHLHRFRFPLHFLGGSLGNHIKDHPPRLQAIQVLYLYIHQKWCADFSVNLLCSHGPRNLFFFILIQPSMELRCLCQFPWQRYPP